MTTDVQESTVTDHDTPPQAGPAETPDEKAAAQPEAKPEPKPAIKIAPPKDLDPQVEAVLLSADRPVPADKLVQALDTIGLGADADAIDKSVDRLNAAYQKTGRVFRIERVGGGLRVMTLPDNAPIVAAFRRARAPSRLSRPALETLSIIAYRQPVTRARLEAIRGVACGEVLRTLLDLKLVMIKGRAEELGRPMLYGTTRHFLDTFGLASLKDLPEPAELAPGGARIADGADGGPNA